MLDGILIGLVLRRCSFVYPADQAHLVMPKKCFEAAILTSQDAHEWCQNGKTASEGLFVSCESRDILSAPSS